MRLFLIVLLLLLWNETNASSPEGQLHFQLTCNDQEVVPGQSYQLPSKSDSLIIETVRFYISNLQFLRKGKVIGSLDRKYLLIDADDPKSLYESFQINEKFDQIQFDIGIDSITSVSGVFGEALDPTNGMYWTWQSGYINFKLEGTSPICPSRNHAFQFHIGGYQSPYKAIRSVTLSVRDCEDIIIKVSIDELLKHLNLVDTYQVMSPNQKSNEIADLLPTLFKTSK